MSIDEIKEWAKTNKTRTVAVVAIALLVIGGLIWLTWYLIRRKYVQDHLPQIMFSDATSKIIDKLEGGYFHPDMVTSGRITVPADAMQAYLNSGETMYGLDRKAGAGLFSGADGQQFWGIIDNAGAAASWPWNDKADGTQTAPNLMPQLKSLAVNIMQDAYQGYAARYLDQEALDIVHTDPGLLLHFIYATWNGSGIFKKFATDINNAVAAGTTDAGALRQIAVSSRLQSGLPATNTANANTLILNT